MSKRQNPTDTDGNNSETQVPSVSNKSRQRFKDSYKEAFPFLISSRKGPTFAHFLVCKKDFSCAHGHDGGKTIAGDTQNRKLMWT